MRRFTKYFKEAVSSQTMKTIDFKNDNFIEIDGDQSIKGKIEIDLGLHKATDKNRLIQVLVILKTAQNLFEYAKKDASDSKDDMTGVFFVPVLIDYEGAHHHYLHISHRLRKL